MWEIFYSKIRDFEKYNYKIDKNRNKIPYIQLFIVILGLVTSFWIYVLHIQLKAQGRSTLICDINVLPVWHV